MAAQANQLQGVCVTLEELLRLRHAAREINLARAHIPGPAEGSHRARIRGSGMEFEEIRVYQPGDDTRAIDWRVTARRNEPYTKLFREDRERPVMLIIDQRRNMFFGSKLQFKSVCAARLAALVAWASARHNDPISGVIIGARQCQETRPSRRRRAMLHLLRLISETNQNLLEEHAPRALRAERSEAPANKQFANALGRAQRITRPGSLALIVSDFAQLDEECLLRLRLLRRRCLLIAAHISDPLERELPSSGNYTFSDAGAEGAQKGKAGGKLIIDTSVAKLRRQFAGSFEAGIERLRGSVSQLLRFDSAEPALQQIKGYWPKSRRF